ncbi:25241_t:CDS:2, partial [Racocetra persica]
IANNKEVPQLNDDLATISLDNDLVATSLDDDLVAVSLDNELVVASYENNKKDDEYANSQEKLYKERVEFYMNIIKLKPLQIQKAIQKEFPDREIYLFKIYKMVMKFYNERQKDITNDAVL